MNPKICLGIFIMLLIPLVSAADYNYSITNATKGFTINISKNFVFGMNNNTFTDTTGLKYKNTSGGYMEIYSINNTLQRSLGVGLLSNLDNTSSNNYNWTWKYNATTLTWTESANISTFAWAITWKYNASNTVKLSASVTNKYANATNASVCFVFTLKPNDTSTFAGTTYDIWNNNYTITNRTVLSTLSDIKFNVEDFKFTDALTEYNLTMIYVGPATMWGYPATRVLASCYSKNNGLLPVNTTWNVDPTITYILNGSMIIDLSDNTYNPLQDIILTNVSNPGALLVTTNIPNSTVNYALDPTNLTFTSGHVDVKNSTGNLLLKCPSWNYSTQICTNDSWDYVTKITPGIAYDFNFTTNDPAYAETSLATGEYSVSSTTFTTLVQKNITPDVTGNYLIWGTGTVGGSATNRISYARATLDGTVFALHNHNPHDSSRSNDYQSYSFLTIKNLNTSQHTINIDAKTSSPSATAFMRDVSINSMLLTSYYAQNTTAEQNMATSQATYNNLTFTPTFGGDYIIYAYGEFGGSESTAYIDYVYLYQDATILDDLARQPMATTDYISFTMFKRVNLNAGQTYSFTQQAKEANAASNGIIRNLRIVAIPVESDYDFQYAENTTQANTTATTPQIMTTLSFQPLYPGTYIISGTANTGTSSTSRSVMTNITVNGVSVCYNIKEPEVANTEYNIFNCIIPYTFANVTNNLTMTYTLLQGAGTAYIKDARLGVYAVNATRNTCEYTGSGLWAFLINKYCRIMRRTLGDGSGINVANLNTTESGVIIRGFNDFNISNSSTFSIDSGTNITIGTY